MKSRFAFNYILFTALLLTFSACGSGGTDTPATRASAVSEDGLRNPACTVDRFRQPTAPVAKKLDVLFVMDASYSMNRHWQLMAAKIAHLLRELPKGQDTRIAVVLGTIEKNQGVLFSAPGQPKVLDATKLNEAQVMASLKATFAQALLPENIDWTGSGEALFLSLHHAVTTRAPSIQKQGFFRSDAGLNVIFMSDDAEINYPYPSRQIWGLPNKCNWAHHERVRKTFYLPRKVNTDTTFAALRRLKGDMPLVTNAFVNITKADIMVDNDMGAECIFDSPGFGYFDIVKRSGGVLWSIHRDRAEGLQAVGRVAKARQGLLHDFRLSKPAAKVDPASIRALVDSAQVEHSYKPDTNTVHLANAGKPGSLVEITHCEPVPQHEWNIQDFSGAATQTTAALRWKTPELATKGRIAYGTDPASLNDTLASGVNSTEHAVSVSGLAPNTTYYFQAIATDEFETEKRSAILSLRTLPAWAMGPLTGSASRNTAVLLWQTAAYPTAGRVIYGTSPEQLSGASAETAPLTAHQVSVEGLRAGTLYYFQAISRDEFGLEQRSNVISLRTAPAEEWAIVGLTGTAGRFDAALRWATPEAPTESELRYGLAPDALNEVAKDSAVAIEHGVKITGLNPGTTYYFQAIARDGEGVEKRSGIISLSTIADWNISAVASTSTETSFTVTFATAGFPTSGKVIWGLSAGALGFDADAGFGTGHGASVSGLSPDTLYYYRAVASDELGQQKMSEVASIRTKPQELPPPQWSITGFEGSATTDTAHLIWNTSGYPTKGYVRYGTSPGSLTGKVSEQAASLEHTLSVPGLQPDTLYYFQVVAADDRGREQESTVLALRTQTEETPLPSWEITSFTATPSVRSIEARWFTEAYKTRGKVRYGTSRDLLNQETPWEESPSVTHAFQLSGLSPDTAYFLMAVSQDDRGQTRESEVIEVKTLAPAPAWQVTGFDGTTTSTQANLIWQTPGVATKAEIRVGLSASDLTFLSVPVPSFASTHVAAVTGLSPGTAYFFQIVAEDADGGKVTSNIISKTTKP